MPLVDVSAEMGAMLYASGTHEHGFLGQHKISEQSQIAYSQMIEAEQIPVVSAAPMHAGDATFHFGWTLHAAGANTSQTLRAAMIVTYFADGMRVASPQNSAQEHDRVKFLGDTPVGELARGPLNPLVWG